MPDQSIIDATTRNCIFYQNESARFYAAAMWEYENGALSRVTMMQERAAEYASEARMRLDALTR